MRGENVSSREVAVLVLNYNGRDYLKRCLPSLLRTSFDRLRVVVVDNASSDGSLEFMRKAYPGIEVLANKSNLGFCRAYNDAVRRVSSKYSLFLNGDTEIPDPSWISRLILCFDSDPRIAAVCPKIAFLKEPETLNSVGADFYSASGPVDRGIFHVDDGTFDLPNYEPFYAPGTAMMVKREVFLKIGGFDEAMFAYVEDVDLCWRMRLSGYKISVCPGAKILHDYGGSWRSNTPRQLYLLERNLIRSMLKNYEIRTATVMILMHLTFSFSLKVGGVAFRTKNWRASAGLMRALLWNIKNLRSTLVERAKIQSSRLLSDRAIIAHMQPKPLESPISVLRRSARILGNRKL